MLYAALLALHSIGRWFALLLPVVVLQRASRAAIVRSPETPLDRRLLLAATIALDVQALFGLLLWLGVSPLGVAGIGRTPGLMKNPVLRYWAVEHGPVLLVALLTFHALAASAKKLEDATSRHRRVAIAAGVVVLAILATMPWPGLPYGRPLLPHA